MPAKKQHKPFRLLRSEDNQFYFVVVADNGKILVTSETYKSKRNAKQGIEAIDYLFFKYDIGRCFDNLEDVTEDLT